MEKVKFVLIGRGWRADYFKNVAALVPSLFEIVEEVNGKSALDWNVQSAKDKGAQFAVVSVTHDALHPVSLSVIKQGLPVLMETPAAETREKLDAFEAELEKIPNGKSLFSLAENYPFRPDIAARIECIRQDLIGEPSVATVSYANTYHAIAIMRKLLRLDAATLNSVGGADAVEINGTKFPVLSQAVYSRAGAPKEKKVELVDQTMAVFRFPNVNGSPKTGIYNFEDAQHRAYDRTRVIEIKGDHGTIHNETLHRQIDFQTPVESHILRRNIGEFDNVEGTGLYAFIAPAANPKYVWKNRYLEVSMSEFNQMNCRLNDDELACADLLSKMSEYVQSGFKNDLCPYSFGEAKIDTILWEKLEKSIS